MPNLPLDKLDPATHSFRITDKVRRRRWLRDRRAPACVRLGVMPITPFLAGQPFDPEAVHAMSMAFDSVCKSLGLRAGADPTAEIIAKKVIELAQRGVRDPAALGERVLRELD